MTSSYGLTAHERHKQGLCMDCPKPIFHEKSKWLCLDHYNEHRAGCKRRVEERIAAGLCVACGKNPNKPGRKRCQSCLNKIEEANKRSEARKRGEKPARPLAICQQCKINQVPPERHWLAPCGVCARANKLARDMQDRLRLVCNPEVRERYKVKARERNKRRALVDPAFRKARCLWAKNYKARNLELVRQRRKDKLEANPAYRDHLSAVKKAWRLRRKQEGRPAS